MSSEEGKAETGNKRRRNKKNKKKSKSNDSKSNDNEQQDKKGTAVAVASGPAQQDASKLNPHALLRNKLLQQGYSEAEIDNAMEAMWNMNLAYDEYDAVLKYLKSPQRQKEVVEQSAESVQEKPGVQEFNQLEPDAAAEKSEASADGQKTTEDALDVIAGIEALSDAIDAMTKWVNETSQPHEVEDLCSCEKTLALQNLFRRSIAEGDEQASFDTLILPAMVDLIISLLQKSGIPASGVAETKRPFENVMQQARRVFQMQQPSAEAYLERISRFIVSRLSLAIDESKISSTVTNGELTMLMGASIDDSISDLLSKRESHLTAAKRSAVLARSACASLTTPNQPSSPRQLANGPFGDVEVETSDILLAILGEDGKNTLDAQKAALEGRNEKSNEGKNERLEKLQRSLEEVQSERNSIQKKVGEIQKHINELKKSIQKFEAKESELLTKANALESEIEAEFTSISRKSTMMERAVEEASNSKEFHASVGTLVDILKRYDDSLDRAVDKAVNSSAIDDNVDSAASRQMESFISRANNYFASEKLCIDFLRGRIASLNKEVNDLKSEVTEYESIGGMSTTIQQLEKSIQEKEALVEQDSSLVGRLTDEASSLFTSLMNRLEDYVTAQDKHTLTPIYPIKLRIIYDLVVSLGIPNTDRLDSFIIMNAHGPSPRNMDPLVTPKGGKVAPIGTPKSTSEEPAIPKFSWGTNAGEVDPASKPSLLDIQKEELQSKET